MTQHAMLARALTLSLPACVPHRPHPKQHAFLLMPQREILFGGAAGGGKSDALLMAALQYIDVPGYSALILRCTSVSLRQPGGLIPRSQEWLAGTNAKWNDTERRWTWPNGATLSFGYLETDRDKYRYQSSEFHFIGFEELTEFRRENDYLWMFQRARKPATGPLSAIPIRIRATTNPIGPGAEWVHRRFILGTKKGDAGRAFLPSTLDDNPSLDAESYEQQMAELPTSVREALRHGRWVTGEQGLYFPAAKWEWLEPRQVPRDLPRVCRFWDLAGTPPSETNPDPDWTYGVKVGMDEAGKVYILDAIALRDRSDVVYTAMTQAAKADGRHCRVRWEQEPGQSGKAQTAYLTKLLAGFDVGGVPSSGSKEVRAAPLSAQHGAGNCHIVVDASGWQNAFVSQLESFPFGRYDDAVDAASGAFNTLTTSRAKGRRVPAFGPRLV